MKGASRSVGNSEAQQALIAHWQGIVKSLTNFLNTLKSNHVSVLDTLVMLMRDHKTFINLIFFSYIGSSVLGPKGVHADILIH